MLNKQSAGRSLGKLSNQVRRYMDAAASSSKITGVQGRILHFILAQPMDEIFQKDIEEEFNLRPATATINLQLMEKNGLITRASTAYDARLKQIFVTPKAAELKELVMQDIYRLDDTLMKDIQEDKLKVFFEVIGQMLKNIE